jgi:hypothetical protein
MKLVYLYSSMNMHCVHMYGIVALLFHNENTTSVFANEHNIEF